MMETATGANPRQPAGRAEMNEIVVRTAQDIIDALELNPEFLNRVRNHILTKRPLELPDQVDTRISSVQQLADTVSTLADRMQRVEERQEIFDQRQQRFENTQHGFQSRLDGDRYQNRALNTAPIRAAAELRMDQPRVIAPDGNPSLPEWHSILQPAFNRQEINHEDIEELTNADIALADQQGRYAIIESAVSANASDVTRARRRADLLSTIVKGPVIAAVICARHNQEAQSLTLALDVTISHLRD